MTVFETASRRRRPSGPASRGTVAVALALALACGNTAAVSAGALPARETPAVTKTSRHVARAPSQAPAQLTDADRHFRRGVELYDDGDMSAAHVEFARAYELVPHFKVLYNLGQVAYQRQDYVKALDFFRRYLVDGHGSLPRERRHKVEQDIRRLEQRIGHIDIRTESADDGADILLDDVRVGQAPVVESMTANVGQRKLQLVRRDGQRETRVVDVVGTETVHVQFARAPARLSPDTSTVERVLATKEVSTAVAHAADTYVHETAVRTTARRVPWLSWSIAGVLAGGAVAAGGLAYSASRDLQQRREGYPLEAGDLDSSSRRARALGLAADGLLAGTLVATAISLYLTVRTPAKESNIETERAHAARQLRLSAKSSRRASRPILE